MTDQLSRVFAALADPVRRDLLARLAVGDFSVGRLAEPHDISVQAISKHLKVLEEAGLVTRVQQGSRTSRRPVHLEAEVFDLVTKWIERYQRQAEGRYRRLDAVLADMTAAAGDGSGSSTKDTGSNDSSSTNSNNTDMTRFEEGTAS